MTRTSTIFLYVSILCISTLCSMMAQKRRVLNGKVVYYFRFRWYVASFLVAWFFCAFTDIGVDYSNYIRIISSASLDNLFSGEVGLNALAVLFKFFLGNNFDGVYFALKTSAILIAYYAIWKLRNKANLGLAVFSYILLSYLRFYLVGMHISTALVLLSIVYLVEDCDRKALISYCLACTMHYSAVLLTPAYLLFYLIMWRGKRISRIMIVLLSIAYLLIVYFASSLYMFLTSSISIFSHYAEHGLIDKYQGTGLMQFVFFAPILYMGLQMHKKHSNKRLINMTLIWGITSFFFGMLGYSMNVVARMYEHFIGLYIVFVPMFLFDRRNHQNIRHPKYWLSYRSEMFVWICCVCMRGFDIWYDVLQVASSAQVDRWNFFFPF